MNAIERAKKVLNKAIVDIEQIKGITTAEIVILLEHYTEVQKYYVKEYLGVNPRIE